MLMYRHLLRFVRQALVLGLLAGAAGMTWADTEPAEFSDPVRRMLIERGLLKPDGTATSAVASPPLAEPSLGQKMRDSASDMVVRSMNFLGVPYQLGGTSESTGFDCSGFTRFIFEHSIGVMLPRRADEQARAPGLVPIRRADLKPGDLVFFNTLRRTFSHVGIYVGEGKFIHAPRTGAFVRVEDMRFSYWSKRFTGARRVPGLRQENRLESAMASPSEIPSDLYTH
ncbi:MAG: C40 family peptidase [Pseudomonadota bacterium]